MTVDEDEEITRVGLAVYKKYFQYGGGWTTIAVPMLLMVFFIGAYVISDYMIGAWAVAPDQRTNYWYYFGWLWGSAITMCLFMFLRIYFITVKLLAGAKKIHDDAVKKIVKAPINTYFDVTPAGRILNRFSKDLTLIDQELIPDYRFLSSMVSFAIMRFCIAFYAVPILILILPFVIGAVYMISFRNIPVYREMNRIESVTKSPILTSF